MRTPDVDMMVVVVVVLAVVVVMVVVVVEVGGDEDDDGIGEIAIVGYVCGGDYAAADDHDEIHTSYRLLHPKHAPLIDTRSLLSVAQRLIDERRHKVHARLASQHHSVLQRLRRLQSVGVNKWIMHVKPYEMTQTVRHEHAVDVEGKRSFGAAFNQAGGDKIAQQQHGCVAMHVVVIRA